MSDLSSIEKIKPISGEKEYSPYVSPQRLFALLLFIISAICVWYSIILLTNPVNGVLMPNKQQWIGFVIVIFISILSWVSRIYTIQPSKTNV